MKRSVCVSLQNGEYDGIFETLDVIVPFTRFINIDRKLTLPLSLLLQLILIWFLFKVSVDSIFLRVGFCRFKFLRVD